MGASSEPKNVWVRASIDAAYSKGYLDRLSSVYPISLNVGREVDEEDVKTIKAAFKKGNKKELISVLLGLKRFPIDDAYIGFIRRNRKALDSNPVTIRRIGERLVNMGLEAILEGARRPQSTSRQMGPSFRNWLCKQYPVLKPSEFLSSRQTAVLHGNDAALKEFARRELGYRGQKGLDLVVKAGNRFLIGEAKLISSSGGTQHKSFRETMTFIKSQQGRATRIAVLDGVVWLSSPRGKDLFQGIKKLKENQIAISALLLPKLIKALTLHSNKK